ncbi:hypothetical protein QVD17_29776 [Tagetes erecta]|uniref:F-box domain-containing protein n=1 Tax=Tagetes erecta TaxID=13708 RepID=A0AAD8K278_TARER|nr:hypothetical protein QVD17_29776 [Tagetes erecta]
MAKHHHCHTTELPPDVILVHILPRLAANTILRLKSVCKEWHSFLNTPKFHNLHHHHVTNNHHQCHHKLLTYSKLKSSCEFLAVDCEAPNESVTRVTTPFEVSSPYDVTILSSCNGMIYLGMTTKRFGYDKYFDDLILWNPLTSDYKTLSKTNSHSECCMKRLYNVSKMCYTSSEDDYKILHIAESCNVYIYSLKSDSWRKIESTDNDPSLWNHRHPMPSASWDDKVYFLNTIWGLKTWVTKFDAKTEKFTKVSNISSQIQTGNIWSSVHVQKPCLHFCVSNMYDGRIELFRMNEDEHWTKLETYFSKRDGPNKAEYVDPLHLMRNGNWLVHYPKGYCLDIVDVNKYINEDHEFEPRDISKHISVMEKYIETLVSPNRYIV